MATTTSTGTTEQTIPAELAPYFTGTGTSGTVCFLRLKAFTHGITQLLTLLFNNLDC